MMKRLLPVMLVALALFVLAGNAQAAKKGKAFVCHKDDEGEYKTLRISGNAVQAHLNHGDMMGKCEDIPTEQAVVIFRCGTGDAVGEPDGGLVVEQVGELVVTVVSVSENLPAEAPEPLGGDECAEANASLLNGGFELEQVNSGAGMDLETEYMYVGEFKIMEPVGLE
jgi:hypothetical protein